MPLQHPVPDSHLKAIGDITVSFALLESVMQSLTHAILGISQRNGQIVTAELSFKNIRALTVSLYLEQHGKAAEFIALRSLMKRAETIETKRNQITHSAWAVGNSTTSVTRMKTTAKEAHGIRCQFEPVTSSQLNAFATEIKQLAEDMLTFHISLIQTGKVSNSNA